MSSLKNFTSERNTEFCEQDLEELAAHSRLPAMRFLSRYLLVEASPEGCIDEGWQNQYCDTCSLLW